MRLSHLVVQTLAVLTVSSFATRRSGQVLFARAEDDDDQDDSSPLGTVVDDTEPPVYVPPENAKTFTFEAEVHKMLDIVVNSLYQNNDVFLRELISNASDALDKIRYLLLTEPDTYGGNDSDATATLPLEVKLEYDTDAKTLTIRDTGVGMTHEEMVQNLGTVARSGTTKFMQALKESGNQADTMAQIGQFGVGFYSTFLVADRVTVASKHPTDATQYVWESTNGASEFVVYEDPRGNSLGRGTEITLHLKSSAGEYATPTKLKSMAQHYSEFVTHPISLRTTETVQVDVEDEDEGDDSSEKKESSDEDDLEVGDEEDGDGDDEASEKPKQTKEVTTHSWEVLNGNPAIWTRDKDDITDDEYQAFFKVLSPTDASNATTWSHFNAEGNINFKSLLYLPTDIPANYKYGNIDKVEGAMRLYVRKVLIGDAFDLLPKYLGFIHGVVDSDDLPLNVNRETLQESKILKVIQKKVVRKAIDLIRQLAKESETEEIAEPEEGDEKKMTKYEEWYSKFSPNLKLGVLEDYGNQAKLVKLLRFQSSKSDGKMISFKTYVENMKDWQKDIYVLGCANAAECERSPFLETFQEKDVEVLFFADAIDEYMIKQVRDYDGKKIVQISSESAKLNDEDEDMVKRRQKVYDKQFMPLKKYLGKLFKDSIMRVQVAKRSLGSNPAIVSSLDFGNSANMERIMRAQAFQHGADPNQMNSMRVFELNPRHPLVLKLLEGMPAEDDTDAKVSAEIEESVWMLHDVAMLAGGFSIHDVSGHNKRMIKVLQSGFALDSLALEPEINPPVEEDEPPASGDDDDMGEFNLDDMMGGMGGMDGMDMEQIKKMAEEMKESQEDHEEL